MTDRQPYIDALSRALPGGLWTACNLSPIRIRSQAFEAVDIMFAADHAPCLSICRLTYTLPADPYDLALNVRRILWQRADEMVRSATMLRRMLSPAPTQIDPSGSSFGSDP